MKKILIIEDDRSIRSGLEDDFRFEGYEVESAVNGKDGLSKAIHSQPDLIILDLMLPEMDGLEVCKELRRRNIGIPIIMLTAKSQDFDIVVGLELGADDYVTKPFSPHALRARVKAQLRRAAGTMGNGKPEIYEAGSIKLDVRKHECLLSGVPVILTSIEFDILKMLITHAGEVVRRDDLLDAAWGDDVVVTQRSVDTHIVNLRRKLSDNPKNPKLILSIRSLGYKLKMD